MLWRVLGVLVALFIVISILGFVIDALRWLLGLAVLLAVGALIVGAFGRSQAR